MESSRSEFERDRSDDEAQRSQLAADRENWVAKQAELDARGARLDSEREQVEAARLQLDSAQREFDICADATGCGSECKSTVSCKLASLACVSRKTARDLEIPAYNAVTGTSAHLCRLPARRSGSLAARRRIFSSLQVPRKSQANSKSKVKNRKPAATGCRSGSIFSNLGTATPVAAEPMHSQPERTDKKWNEDADRFSRFFRQTPRPAAAVAVEAQPDIEAAPEMDVAPGVAAAMTAPIEESSPEQRLADEHAEVADSVAEYMEKLLQRSRSERTARGIVDEPRHEPPASLADQARPTPCRRLPRNEPGGRCLTGRQNPTMQVPRHLCRTMLAAAPGSRTTSSRCRFLTRDRQPVGPCRSGQSHESQVTQVVRNHDSIDNRALRSGRRDLPAGGQRRAASRRWPSAR